MLRFPYLNHCRRFALSCLFCLLSTGALAQAPAAPQPAAAAPSAAAQTGEAALGAAAQEGATQESAAEKAAAGEEPAAAPERRILVLGDSISAAYGMSLQQGWVSLLDQYLAQTHPDVRVINASISGETSAGGLRRLPALLTRHQPELLLIELGGNDGLRGFPLLDMRYNLEQMVYTAKKAGARVILLPMQIPPNYGARYSRVFAGSFARAAELTGATLAPFILEGVAGDPELMQEDGIHPRAEAQAKLLANVLPSVLRALKSS